MNLRPIPILLFSNATVRGGAEEHILQLVGGFDRSLFEPHLACPAELAEQIRNDLPCDVGLHPLMLDRVTDFAGARKLAQVLRRNRIQILHSHMFRASLFASPIGRLYHVPVIIETSHGREVWRAGWLKSRFFVDRFTARFVDRLIAVSDATARYLTEEKGIAAEKISVIRSAIVVDQFDPQRRAPAGLKASLGFAESDPVIAILGRLEPQKGHQVLIEAMPEVVRAFPSARLVCLSDGSLRPELEKMVAEMNLNENVRFVGRQPDIRDWLALSDFTVLSSFYEGLPLAAIESLAMCRPVVATAVDGTPEVVLDGKTGLTVPPGNPRKLAQAICRMLREPEWARETARAGREYVLQHFSVKNLVQKTQELYLRTWQEKTSRDQADSRDLALQPTSWSAESTRTEGSHAPTEVEHAGVNSGKR